MSRKFLTVLVILTSYLSHSIAQNITITYENPSGVDALTVCDSSIFHITLTNSSNTTMDNIILTVDLPTGVSYNTGTITDATESNLTNLNTPVFSVPNLTSGQEHNISFYAFADCSLIAAINAMQLFSNNILVNFNGGSNTITTIPYNIETPLLVMENTGTLIQSGIQEDLLSRSFTITNTRIGALHSFTFIDNHEGGIAISSDQGTDISSQDNLFELVLSGADFSTIGDGDELFELDESITIIEEISIVSCGQPLSSTTSGINATWGCNADLCQSTTPIEGYIAIEVAYLEPELSFTPINDDIPFCYCTGEAVQNGLIINNTSSNTATDITIEISQLNNFAGIDPTSFSIDSSGFITAISSVLSDTSLFFNDSCNINVTTYKDAVLNIPILSYGESFILYWDAYVCALDCTSKRNSSWKYTYDYFSLCPPIPKISGAGFYLGESPYINSQLVPSSSNTFTDGSINTIEYSVISPELVNSGEQLTIEFEIPCGLIWQPGNDLVLDGQTPSTVSINNTVESSFITATYNPPFSSDSISVFFDVELICDNICEELLCKDTIITSCLDICESDIPIGLSIKVNSSLQMVEDCPTICNLNTCANLPIDIDCTLPLCEEYIPGYAENTFSAARTNFGLPDNNDDRLVDPGGTMDFSLVRADRLIAGDTVEVNVNSIVRIDEPGYSFPAGQILINISAGGLVGDNIALFQEGGIVPISRRLSIYDNSSNTYYDCDFSMPILINTLDNSDNFSFQFDISTAVLSAGGCLPSDFEYSAGDSILFKQQFRIIHNLIPIFGSSTPPITDLKISPQVFLLNENSTEPNEDWFNCGCQGADMQLSGYRYNLVAGIHAIPECDASIFLGGSLFSFSLGIGNFFPFEHRSLGQLVDWQLEMPDGFSIVESKITSMELQQNIPLFNNLSLTPSSNNNTYQYNLLPFQTPELDEGFSILIQNRFLANCALTGSYPMSIKALIDPAPNLIFPALIDTTVTKPAALRMLVPNISLDATFFNNISYDDQAEWDFTLFNNVTNVASFTSGPARNVWVRPFSLSGLVTDFELTDGNTGMVFPQVNGIFQLGELDSLSSFELHLTAMNSSCISETVELHYGWNCEPYNNPITTACNDKVAYFTVLSPPAAIEQSVESPIGPHFLCDTIDYHTITVFNADLGTAYNSTIELQLPPGVFIIPGSSEIAYPSNDNFFAVADPIDTGTGTLLWNISTLQDSIGQNGLPGFIFSPNHSYQLRFKLYTDCAFIAGSYPIFFANAEQICGIPTNTLAEAADPILLDGLPPPYQSSISATSSVSTISCENNIPINVNITADANTINGDSIFITLPSNINYVPNSISGNSNMLIQEPNIEIVNNLQILKWPLIAGISPGTSIVFEFNIEGFSELDCGSQILLLQTVGPASALCTSDNSVCDILVETGSNLIQLNIDRAAYGLSDFEITVTPSGGNELIDYEILVSNTGFDSSPPILLDFYLDSDNSGTWTPADIFITNNSFNNTITNGGNITLSGNFNMTSGQACDLIAVIDQTQHCACFGDEQFLTTIVNYLIPDEIILCSGESETIGITGSTGATYQWIPETGLTCDDCPTTDIDLTNTSNSPNSLTYTLTEDDGQGCVTAYVFTLELQPQLVVNNSMESICSGETITLQAPNASSYIWSGPGISNPTLPTQTVTPNVSSVYTIQLTDNFGCSSTDSIQVIVSDPPIAFAGNDTLFCESSVVQLQAFFDGTYTYQWSPANFLDNPNSPNPTIINNTETTYLLTVTNNQGCQNTDQVYVDFGAAPTLTGQTAHSICPGDSVQLSFNGAMNYSWSPAIDLSCINCPEPYASPETSTIYTLTGTDNIGCSSDITVAVNLLSDGAVTTEMADLCEGESILVYGQMISTPGIYCDTLVSQFTGCDSIRCVVVEENTDLDTEEELIICEGESIDINGTTYDVAGTYCNTSQTLAGCDSSHCVVLQVRENPIVNNILPEVTIELGDTVALGPFPMEYSYSWSPSEGLSCDDCFNPLASPLEDTEYRVIVMDSIGCNEEFIIQTRTTTPICLPPHVFIPNAFTPNGDNENDVLRVYGNSIERLHLMIFNRWGEKVFETVEIDGFWDGTFKGKLLGTDVFGYYLEVDCIGGESFTDKGNITLLR